MAFRVLGRDAGDDDDDDDYYYYIHFIRMFLLNTSLFFSRYLTEKVVPGNRVTIIGIYSIKKVMQKSNKVSQ